jgi:hypothetical protein
MSTGEYERKIEVKWTGGYEKGRVMNVRNVKDRTTHGSRNYINLLSLLVTWCTNKFNSQQLYALATLCLCVLYLSENKQRLVPLTA